MLACSPAALVSSHTASKGRLQCVLRWGPGLCQQGQSPVFAGDSVHRPHCTSSVVFDGPIKIKSKARKVSPRVTPEYLQAWPSNSPLPQSESGPRVWLSSGAPTCVRPVVPVTHLLVAGGLAASPRFGFVCSSPQQCCWEILNRGRVLHCLYALSSGC